MKVFTTQLGGVQTFLQRDCSDRGLRVAQRMQRDGAAQQQRVGVVRAAGSPASACRSGRAAAKRCWLCSTVARSRRTGAGGVCCAHHGASAACARPSSRGSPVARARVVAARAVARASGSCCGWRASCARSARAAAFQRIGNCCTTSLSLACVKGAASATAAQTSQSWTKLRPAITPTLPARPSRTSAASRRPGPEVRPGRPQARTRRRC